MQGFLVLSQKTVAEVLIQYLSLKTTSRFARVHPTLYATYKSVCPSFKHVTSISSLSFTFPVALCDNATKKCVDLANAFLEREYFCRGNYATLIRMCRSTLCKQGRIDLMRTLHSHTSQWRIQSTDEMLELIVCLIFGESTTITMDEIIHFQEHWFEEMIYPFFRFSLTSMTSPFSPESLSLLVIHIHQRRGFDWASKLTIQIAKSNKNRTMLILIHILQHLHTVHRYHDISQYETLANQSPFLEAGGLDALNSPFLV